MSDKKYETENELLPYLETAAYLFEQTYITNDVLNNLPTADIKSIIDNIAGWYLSDLMQISNMSGLSGKKDNTQNAAGIRDIYISFFKIYKILPSELAKQPPLFVFSLLNQTDNEQTAAGALSPGDLPADLQALYGL